MKNVNILLIAAILCLSTSTTSQAKVAITYEGPGLSYSAQVGLNYTLAMHINSLSDYALIPISFTTLVKQTQLPPFYLNNSSKMLSPVLYKVKDGTAQIISKTECLYQNSSNIDVHTSDGKTLDLLHFKIRAIAIVGGFDFECDMTPHYR